MLAAICAARPASLLRPRKRVSLPARMEATKQETDHGRTNSASGPADRNKGPILDVLKRHLTESGKVLEIASGVGIHVEHFAPALTAYNFQPTEYAADAVDEIRKRIGTRFPNVAEALQLDCSKPEWGAAETPGLSAMIAINITHIAPIGATTGLLQGAGRLLKPGGLLFIYGPFSVDGKPTTEGNAAFDATLRQRNPEWGYRDVADVTAMAQAAGLSRVEVLEMPANNFMLIFRR